MRKEVLQRQGTREKRGNIVSCCVLRFLFACLQLRQGFADGYVCVNREFRLAVILRFACFVLSSTFLLFSLFISCCFICYFFSFSLSYIKTDNGGDGRTVLEVDLYRVSVLFSVLFFLSFHSLSSVQFNTERSSPSRCSLLSFSFVLPHVRVA